MKKRKPYEDDDGRTIANMNVDGMPWFAENPVSDTTGKESEHSELGRHGTIALIWGVLKAALLVTAVFAGGYLLFILFCTLIWFK
jgi:hypothetical protein